MKLPPTTGMHFFGMPYPGNSWLDEAERMATPIGEPCAFCKEPFVEGDAGYHGLWEWGNLHNCCFWFIMNGIPYTGIDLGDLPTPRQFAEAAMDQWSATWRMKVGGETK